MNLGPEDLKSSSNQDTSLLALNTGIIQLSIQTGDDFYQEGRYYQALEEYRKINELIASSNSKVTSLETLLYQKLGLASFKIGKYQEGLTFLMKALKIKESMDNNLLDIAYMSVHIGEIYTAQSKFIEAAESLKKAADILSEIKKDDEVSEIVVVCYNNFAELCGKQGKYSEAREYLKKAIKIITPISHTKENRLILATSFYHLGDIYRYLVDYNQALIYLQKSLEIREELYDKEHPDVAACHNVIGHVLLNQGKYDEASQSIKKAYDVGLKRLDPSHPSIATYIDSVGIILFHFRNRNSQVALKNFEKSLKIRLECLGENHLDVATSYNNIANVQYYYIMQYDEALEYYNLSLKIRLAVYGENHPDVAAIYEDIGSIYKEQRSYELAEHNLVKTLQIRVQIFCPKHSKTAFSYHSLATLCQDQQEYGKALSNYMKALKIRLAMFKPDPYEGDCFSDLSLFFSAKHDINLGKVYSKKAAMIYKSSLGSKNYHGVNAKLRVLQIEKVNYLLDTNSKSNI